MSTPGGSRPFGGGGGGRPQFDRDRKGGGGKGGLRVNREIRAPEVRVIDEDGTMLGVFPPMEALRLAEDRGLDLIEIAPTAKPPTCKIMDYGKYKYEQKKKEHEARKNQTVIVIKEIQLRPRTDQHDLDVKLRHARRFLLEGDKVKVNLRYYGREMAHQELGVQLLARVTATLTDIAMVETAPKMEGRQLFALYAPDPAKIKEYEKAHPELVKKTKESAKDEKKDLADDGRDD
ncbi:MAG TPA: translation initiation factor IF-3 [Bdellovibrionales bacterium]|nr:translation initiation factor IF-3 [Bdellovibrionales bacterium]